MKLSENENYMAYIDFLSKGNYDDSVDALAKCLEDFRGDKIKESFLLKLMADAYFHVHKIDKSFEHYAMSEEADAEALQPRLFFAEFLAYQVKKYDQAIKKCDEIAALAKENPVEENNEDFGSNYYASKAEEIRSFCRQKLE